MLVRQFLSISALASLIIAASALGPSVLGEPSSEAVRELVLAQAQAELALSSFEMDRIAEAVSVERGPMLGNSLQLWTGHVSSTGPWHTYVVGSVRGRTIRLGGFEAPELFLASEILRPRKVTLSSVVLLARRLSRLADPEGAEEIVYRTPDVDDTIANQRGLFVGLPGWFADSAGLRFDGSFRVRIAILSHQRRDYATTWIPHFYAFEFGSEGQLRAWTRRSGDDLQLAVVPTGR